MNMVEFNKTENVDNSSELVKEARSQLNQQAAELPADTVAKLDAIRAGVREEVERGSRWDALWDKWSYIPAVAACLLVVVVMINRPAEVNPLLVEGLNDEPTEFELVLVNDDFEALQEDLEFYEWLEQESVSS
jgi:hypothetical protein